LAAIGSDTTAAATRERTAADRFMQGLRIERTLLGAGKAAAQKMHRHLDIL